MFAFSIIFPENIDLLLLFATAVVGMIFLNVWLRRKRIGTGVVAIGWTLLLLILGVGYFWSRQEEAGQKKIWSDYLCGLTATFADTTRRSGHHLIQPRENDTVEDGAATPVKIMSYDKTIQARAGRCRDPEVYEKLIRLHTDWARNLKIVGYVFTVRKTGEKQTEFICSCPCDLDRDGVFEGFMEVGDPPFTPYKDGDEFVWQEILSRGFAGETAIDPNAGTNDYGSWVTAVSPLYGPDNKIEAVLAVDFFVDDWRANTRILHSKTLLLLTGTLLFFFCGVWGYGRLHQNVISFRRMNECLIVAQREAESAAQAKENFLANMSHEIRTPMNAILGMLHLIQRTELSNKQETYLNNAENSAKHLLRIINDILDFSKIEADMMVIEKGILSLKLTLSEIYGMISEEARKKNLELLFEIAEDVPDEIVGDPVRIKQILVNLLNNAVKFTNSGKVQLSIHRVEMDNLSVLLRFSVEDTGIGMTEEQMQKLFLPFSQADISTARKFGGTGLGLAICKSLVDLMNGKIWSESVSGRGSAFHWTARFDRPGLNKEYQVLLPETNPAEFEAAPEELPESAGRFPIPEAIRHARILLVEDNKVDQIVAGELLSAEGFRVMIAANGTQALRLLENNDFDLILMDIRMPEMDGIETTRRIRRNPAYAKLPILAMTAHAMSGDRDQSLEAGMNDYLSKPIEPESLYRTIVKWIKK